MTGNERDTPLRGRVRREGNMSNTHHVCFSGSLACSGPNPCRTCFDLVNQHVVAFAMQQSGMTLEQGNVFFSWIKEGWRRLHTQMMQDPNIAQRALDVTRIRIDPPPGMAPQMAPPPPAPMASSTRMAPLVPMAFPPMTPRVAPPAAPMPSAPTTQMAPFGQLPPEMMAGAPWDGSTPPPFDPRLLLMIASMLQQVQQAAQEEEARQEQHAEGDDAAAAPPFDHRAFTSFTAPLSPQPSFVFPEPVLHAEKLPMRGAAADVVAPAALAPPAPFAAALAAPARSPARPVHGSLDANGTARAVSPEPVRTEMTVEDVMLMATPLADDEPEPLPVSSSPSPGDIPELNGAPRS